MKHLLYFTTFAILAGFALSCNDDDDYDLADYQDWRKQNDEWIEELKARTNPDGTPYYTTVVPAWDPGIYVLMHYFNDRSETADNLVPLSSSTVDVIYRGYTCEGEPFDSSTTVTSYGKKGIMRFQCNQTIKGWTVAMENMHVGDTAEVIVPYAAAYGATMYGTILPYTSLQFFVRLDDIHTYQAAPY